MDGSMASDQYFVVTLLIRMWNVDRSYMTIILNLMLSRITGQIASRMKYLRNAGKFAKCGTITQNAWQVATLSSISPSHRTNPWRSLSCLTQKSSRYFQFNSCKIFSWSISFQLHFLNLAHSVLISSCQHIFLTRSLPYYSKWLPSTDLANFRSISNLNNILKILEQLFVSCLLPHINSTL